MSLRVKASVFVTLEIDCSQPWPAECTADQIFKQAARHAGDSVRTLVGSCATMRLIGAPKVRAVVLDDEPVEVE